ncbi:MAG: pilus assembly protein [Syntrophomonadaceae bacterium]|jgi:Flp pilus assembly protein TadG|nr:pilus assembly protein [Syntrophomonadaceae bacterium]
MLRNKKGQGLVEMALVLPILLFILMGIIEFGWIFASKLELQHATRDLARYSAINITDKGIDDEDFKAGKKNLIENNLVLVKALPADFIVTPGVGLVTIEVDYNLPFLTPLGPLSKIFVPDSTLLEGDKYKNGFPLHTKMVMRSET